MHNNILVLLMLCSLMISQAIAQDQGFIYGKVTTVDDKEYQGAIRWGKEEVFWTDMFNAAKAENDYLQYLTREQKDALDRHQHTRDGNHWVERVGRIIETTWTNVDSRDKEHTHQLAIQFGNIASIRPTARSYADLVLQNGDRFEINGNGYNDMGAEIQVLDRDLGLMKIDWDRIQLIEFMSTPRSLESKFGEPLYGIVETYEGTFEGLVQWDHDERVGTDALDGDTEDGDVSITFNKIKSIERQGGSSSLITLMTGRAIALHGSNDVNSGNRGIIVNTDFGRVDIPWREFKKVTFSTGSGNTKSYSDFKSAKKLNGTVKLESGESYTGEIVFDLDESMDYEVLQGEDDDINYVVLFSEIRKITPKNYDYSTIEMKNGKSITLGEGQDVSDHNTGLLVFNKSKDPVYIKWNDIDTIVLK